VVAVGFGQTPPPQPAKDAPLAGVSVSVTPEPSEYPELQLPDCGPEAVFVQLMAAGLTVSFTFPAPATVTFTVAPVEVNSATTVSAADMATTQFTALLLRQVGVVPVHPKNPDPGLAADVSVTMVPAGTLVVHVPLVVVPVSVQVIPVGALVIVPPPVCGVPACTVSGKVPGPGLKVAETVSVAASVTVQVLPATVQAVGVPAQPANVPGVDSVRITCVPLGY
jgi:hypothetical protein